MNMLLYDRNAISLISSGIYVGVGARNRYLTHG